MKITVIGPGRWGSLITWYVDSLGHDVTLYGIKGTPEIEGFLKDRKNGLLELPQSVNVTTDISCVKTSEVIIISIPSQRLQDLFNQLSELNLKDKIFVLCMKGIEISTGRRLSQIAEDSTDPSNKVAVWIGPGHVQEFYHGIPNCMVIDSNHDDVKDLLIDELSGNLIRFYFGTDLIGNEIGAAAKNVIGIAAGMLDGIGLSSLKGALMARGTREIARLIKAEGGNEMSAYGLCHLGDYEATVFSKYSHNRQYGESFIKKEKYESLAEGYYTVQALMDMAEKDKVELPICSTVYDILYNGKEPRKALDELFSRRLTKEF
ncbi:MAG: glycerol-3-phosphate dehydrogenase [Acutalibacteraceae bacterium]|nr:glycerol-3-phosphate dehydrogenase [Acutalibacteraceae bacterium]